MSILNYGFLFIYFVVLLCFRNDKAIVLLLIGYIIGDRLKLPSGGYRFGVATGRLYLTYFIVASIVYYSTLDVMLTIISMSMINVTNCICDRIVMDTTKAFMGNIHLTIINTLLIGASMCSGNLACSYLLCGMIIGYMFSIVDENLNRIKRNKYNG